MTTSDSKMVKREDVPSFAFLGRMASGKGTYTDSIRRAIEEEFSVQVYRVPSFSAKIADIARDLFGAPDVADGKPDRSLLQAIGAKMKEIDPAVWANYLIRDIKRGDRLPFVVEGLRSSHEVGAFRDNFDNIVVVRIRANQDKRVEVYKRVYGTYPTPEQLEHSTERMIDELPCDVEIVNDYTREGLDENVSLLLDFVRLDDITGGSARGMLRLDR